MFGNFLLTMTNSSKVTTPSPSLSACCMIVSAFLATSASHDAMWFARKMRVSSPFVMTPLPSSSCAGRGVRDRDDVDARNQGRWSQTKIMKANLSLSSLPAPVKFDSAIMNSRTSIWPDFS